ncbi:Aromatic-amino-acid aminotransferase 1 [Metallosphaera sp. J1]|uniref:aminotransferase-like domain-containing protein n=1 Tax=Metallosphaera TaxID=41980 RepID=UPI001EE0DC22|nr:PLP-dependent aminotransferase family protein [Metallosphaera javensis (ex Hofmann et al. 2022)]MCG3109603.1 Aromatic-amino-acid aminotransferase 1 [Metallosphaera javensis (ex Hofmann et al. 2022)]BCS93108.1 MAG: aromatic-amino-acid aminotransferase 1 [Metallosphaera javensis (ex Sakai et al. 2022)]
MPINIGGGLPDPRTFPWERMGEIVDYLLRDRSETTLQYAPSEGIEEVRKEICNFVRKRGFSLEEDQILVTGGAKEAIYLLSELFSQNMVASEEPTFQGFISTMSYRGLRAYPIPWDDHGPMTDVLEKRLKALRMWADPVKYFYVVPVHNPTGRVMTRDRRKHLLELATDFNFQIIEDDIYGFFTYDDPPYPALKSLDREGRVIYISSFSKIVSPGLRVGFIGYEGKELEKLSIIKSEINHQVSTLDQLIIGEMLRRDLVDSIIENSLLLYRKKRNVMLDAIEEYFPSNTGCSYTEGGFFTLCRKEGLDSSSLLKEALKRDVKFIPGEKFFYSSDQGRNSFRLSFSFAKEDEIVEGVRILGELLKSMR